MNEVCLVACSEEFVKDKGGTLTLTAIKNIQDIQRQEIANAKEAGLTPVIDVRMQRLSQHHLPAPPGWHCDGIPRSINSGEYNLGAIHPRAFNISVTLSDEYVGVSNTEFVNDPIKVKTYTEKFYREVHEQVEKLSPSVRRVEDGMFVKYSPKTIHRATETHRSGVRLYLRYSMCEKPVFSNHISPIQQVYVLSEKHGWN